jgi:hypothetical protein
MFKNQSVFFTIFRTNPNLLCFFLHKLTFISTKLIHLQIVKKEVILLKINKKEITTSIKTVDLLCKRNKINTKL